MNASIPSVLLFISLILISTSCNIAQAFQSIITPGTRVLRHRSIQENDQSFRSSSSSSRLNQSTEEPSHDLLVIGAGPVGVHAAILAASAPHNKKVCLVDAPRCSGVLMDERSNEDLSIGGPTGLFSKALRDTSKRINIPTLRGMGLREDSMWNEIISSCLDLASANSRDVRRQLNFAGVEYLEGLASFTGRLSGNLPQVMVLPQSSKPTFLHPKNVLIATGSKPFLPPGIPFDGERIFDSDSVNTMSYLPKSVAITGSGIIAIEYAKIFRNLGAEVTLIIRGNVPRKALMKIGLDKDIASVLVADLVRSGIKFERGAQVKSFDVPFSNPNAMRAPVKLTLEGADGNPLPHGAMEKELLCDAYLAAVGRIPMTDALNLNAVGVELDQYGNMVVRGDLMTNVEGIYGAGDVLGRPFLASTGVAQATASVNSMFGDKTKVMNVCATEDEEGYDENELCIDGDLGSTGASFDPKSLASNPFAFPIGVWSSPEASWYGLTTEQALELGIDADEGIALYAECLRGQVFSPNGLLKLVFEKPAGRILGVHICGDDACELIHYGMELVRSKRTVEDVIQYVYSAVTYHEMYRIAAVAGIDAAGARKRRAAAGAALAARMRNKIKANS